VQILAWLLVGIFLGYVVSRSARREIHRLRAVGHTYGEHHLADASWSTFVHCVICAALFSFVVAHSGTFEDQAIVALLVVGGLWFAIVDLDTHVIPFPAVAKFALGTCVFFGGTIGNDVQLLKQVCIGAVTTWALLFLVRVLSRGDMGGGDVSLGASLGLYSGWSSSTDVYVALIASFMAGGGVALTLLLLRKADRDTHFPFGPCLIVGSLFAVLR
jgi:leader peptidase (prepilin peptidase) / N-methyltransferase